MEGLTRNLPSTQLGFHLYLEIIFLPYRKLGYCFELPLSLFIQMVGNVFPKSPTLYLCNQSIYQRCDYKSKQEKDVKNLARIRVGSL
ncbi:hypothetical protein ES332_A01G101000v1 [Gossypium tomentosum]|uniref:Uncharacterized protein n=1 Tax=Gossypium tomentosum TaxID=34277 RepID=A0A5D2RNR5_GOSTO|nr:hypothetical protein ES332_A01G101000v1 [Gossypium tomentosum]